MTKYKWPPLIQWKADPTTSDYMNDCSRFVFKIQVMGTIIIIISLITVPIVVHYGW